MMEGDEAARPVHVIGASGRSGKALCRALLARGETVVAVVRDAARWDATGLRGEARVADLNDGPALAVALRDARRIVCCAHARYALCVIAAAPSAAKLVFLGSTRKFTRWPDPHGMGVMSGEAAFLSSGRHGVMLHPTMIYGAQGEDNVQRLARLLRRLPLVPLPGGGRALVQPIHQDDVTACVLAALDRPWDGPETAVIAGPEPVRYADFIRAVAAASGLRRPCLISVPAGLLLWLAPLTMVLPGIPTIRRAEIRRMLEDKAFDIGRMRGVLGVVPVGLAEGLGRG